MSYDSQCSVALSHDAVGSSAVILVLFTCFLAQNQEVKHYKMNSALSFENTEVCETHI